MLIVIIKICLREVHAQCLSSWRVVGQQRVSQLQTVWWFVIRLQPSLWRRWSSSQTLDRPEDKWSCLSDCKIHKNGSTELIKKQIRPVELCGDGTHRRADLLHALLRGTLMEDAEFGETDTRLPSLLILSILLPRLYCTAQLKQQLSLVFIGSLRAVRSSGWKSCGGVGRIWFLWEKLPSLI